MSIPFSRIYHIPFEIKVLDYIHSFHEDFILLQHRTQDYGECRITTYTLGLTLPNLEQIDVRLHLGLQIPIVVNNKPGQFQQKYRIIYA